MTTPLELARHIDRVRRRGAPHREGTAVISLRHGVLTAMPGADAGEFASASLNRVYWLAPDSPLGADDIAEARDWLRTIGCPSAFVWAPPWACSNDFANAFLAAGAEPTTNADYIALMRPAGEYAPSAPGTLTAGPVEASRVPEVLAQAEPWYWPTGAQTALRQFQAGLVEIHAVVDGPTVAAISLLTPDADWAYLGSAFTRPDYRGRGAQASLIASRLRRAAELGARWCGCETNTVIKTSLRNLRVAGFRDTISWRVFRWRLPA